MKRILSFIFVLMSILFLIGCSEAPKPKIIDQKEEQTQEESSYARKMKLTTLLEVSPSMNENLIRILILTNSDFVEWSNQDLSVLTNDELFDLFIIWYETPKNTYEEEIIEDVEDIKTPSEEPKMPELKYYEEWGLSLEDYENYLGYAFVYIKDGSIRALGYSPNLDWDEYGIPIPVLPETVNEETWEHEEYALNYWEEHFNGPNADYKLPNI